MGERTTGTRIFGLRPLEFLKYAFFAALACLSAYRIYASYLREVADVRPQEAGSKPRPAVKPLDVSTLLSPATSSSSSSSSPSSSPLPPPTRSAFDYAPTE